MLLDSDRTGTTRRIAVVPAYNEEPTVAQVLDKLSYFVDELVVVDDGSTDRTRAEIEALAAAATNMRGFCPSTRTRACRPRTTSRSPTYAGACATASCRLTISCSRSTPTDNTTST